jgi:transcriptional regulator of acetoin/glycerol metabolism
MYGQEPTLKRSHLPARMTSADADMQDETAPLLRDSQNPVSPGLSKIVHKRNWRKTDDDSEFEALLAALRAHGGSVARAATALGLTRARAYRVLSAHPEFSLDALRD